MKNCSIFFLSGLFVFMSADLISAEYDKEQNRKMDNIAKQIKLKQPLRILYLGDSLSDKLRRHNYTDKVNFWLNKYNPGKASFYNAGVGGDNISRICTRLRGMSNDKPAYRQNMYDKLFEPEPDIVFIFLGHNDTKASSRSEYKNPMISPERQEKLYREAIGFIREKSKAKIVMLSSTCSVFEICKANAAKSVAKGKSHNLFGKPEAQQAFNAVLKKLSIELDLDYVDVYTPTKDHLERVSLFFPKDGVHLTEKGNEFIASLLLDYLLQTYHLKPVNR